MQSLPLYELRQEEREGQRFLWGILRKKWLVAQPEEYVRQCLIRFLTEDRQVPTGLMSVERGLKVAGGLRRRYDLVVYDRNAQPLICCECKAPDVPIDQKALRQLSIYNTKVGARHLLLTNGPQFYFLSPGAEGKLQVVPEMPVFLDLL